MSIDDLADEDGEIFRPGNKAFKDISEMTARELAYSYKTSDRSQQAFYNDFLKTQSDDYRKEFDEALSDPSLEDEFGDES